MSFVKGTYLKRIKVLLVIAHCHFRRYEQKLSVNVIGVI